MNITGKVACITGASKGIGRATALALAKEGAAISISARDKKLLESTAREARDLGVRVFSYPGDMSVEAEIKTYIKETKKIRGGQGRGTGCEKRSRVLL